jgi:hypothetical protein
MIDFTQIMAAFQGVKSLIASSDNPQLYTALNALHEGLLSSRTQILDLEDEARKLKKIIDELKEQKIIDSDLELIRGALFKKSGGWPYCSRCWQSEKKLINLHDINNRAIGCPDCKTTLTKAGPLLDKILELKRN